MIIRTLEVENLLKYRSLRLQDLPQIGVIGVSGDNETGKSAIGEIICFALFGRTYSLAGDDLGKLVHWGAGRGSVTLGFTAADRDYELTRHLGRDGEQSARLVRSDQSQDPVARGLDAVQAELKAILGFDFDDYVETFYLAQREITRPHAQGAVVKAMAGMMPLERCALELRQEADRAEEDARALQGRIKEVERELSLLRPERLKPEDLEVELESTRGSERKTGEHAEQLSAAADLYCAASAGGKAYPFRHGLASLLSAVVLLAAVVVVGFAGLIRFAPQTWPVPLLRERLEAFLAPLGVPLEAVLVYAGVALAGVMVLIWLWRLTLSLGMRRRRARGRCLAEELRRVDELEPAPTAVLPAVSEEDIASGPALREVPRLVDRPDSERRARLGERAAAFEASGDEVRAAVQHELAWIERRQEGLLAQRRILEEKLKNAGQVIDRYRELSGENESSKGELQALAQRIATRRLAGDLLGGAASRMSDRFNDRLRELVGEALPGFTGGRYDCLQMDERLKVRAFSTEKRSFLDIDEVSDGTQRQILLALRLALAQELVKRAVRDRQFAFLDEPFAFSDDSRMRGALTVLPELSDAVCQYWVVAQRFPGDPGLALEIACGGHPDRLEVGRSEAD